MEFASGTYLNFYEENGLDIFIIINEPNTEATSEELYALTELVEATIKEFRKENIYVYDIKGYCNKLTDILNEALEKAEFYCLAFGFQIMINC